MSPFFFSSVRVLGATTFDSVLVAAPVTLSFGTLTLSGSSKVDSGTITIATGSLISAGSQTLNGSGQVVFDAPFASLTNKVISNSSTLTIGPATTIRTGSGSGTLGTSSTSLVNQGTISAETVAQSVVT